MTACKCQSRVVVVVVVVSLEVNQVGWWKVLVDYYWCVQSAVCVECEIGKKLEGWSRDG